MMPCPPTILLYLPGAEGHAWRHMARYRYPGWMAILFRMWRRWHAAAVRWVYMFLWFEHVAVLQLERNPGPLVIDYPVKGAFRYGE
jgi:hypothetical protein